MARRYKGAPSRRALGLEYPHQVVFEIPPGGMRELVAMGSFCTEHSLKHSTMAGEKPPPPRDVCIFSFTCAEDAELFYNHFGGEQRKAVI